MSWLIDLFTQESIGQSVVVFGLVIALGILLGKVKIGGISLGVTWVLFIGLLVSYAGIHVNKEIEHFLKEFGLILFVYCIGLQVGPGFFAALKKDAHANNIMAAVIVLSGISITFCFYLFTDTPIQVMTGIMSGAVTNTPGLGAAQTALTDIPRINTSSDSLMPLSYALVYPFGVFGIIFSMLILKKLFKTNIDSEAALYKRFYAFKSDKLVSKHLNLENKQLYGQPIRLIFQMLKTPFVIPRLLQDGKVIIPTPNTLLKENDVLLVVVPRTMLDKLKIIVGGECNNINLEETSDGDLISRDVIVTQSEITHKRLGDIMELHLTGFTFTRLTRAGIEMVPHGGIILQLGDKLSVVGERETVGKITKVLGNSLKRLEAPDLSSIFIGIALGVIVGSIPFHFPNIPVPVKIGLAGGPLIVALLLSRFGNVVYLNNYTTHSANLFIREMGIAFFLAAVGLGSGAHLTEAFSGGHALQWILMGIAITMLPLIIIGLIAKYYLRKSYFEICGLLAGACTDPPALAFATQMAKNDIPSITYATVYPLTMILRIIGAQLLILLLTA